MSTIYKPRRAVKPHDCWYCREFTSRRATIRPGDRYLSASLPPHDDPWFETWMHSKECGRCAVDLGRGHLLNPNNNESTKDRQ